MTNTEKRLEKHTKEVIIEQIDICLSGQDPRYELGRYVEKLREEIIHQAIAEERERVRGEIEKKLQEVKPLYKFGDIIIDSQRMQDGTILGQQKALSDILSSLQDINNNH